MKKMPRNLIWFLPLIACLASCGYDLKEVYTQDAYNSPVFQNNYYTHYDSKIDPDNENNSIRNVREVEITSEHNVAETYDEAKANNIDVDMNKDIEYVNADGSIKTYHGLEYIYDHDVKKDYGPNKKMNVVDSIFSYGYLSKLYDGQLFCNGYYQLARVQINERGFGVLYEKELINMDYIAISFKVSVDYTTEISVPAHDSTFRLCLTFYQRDGSNFDAVKTYHTFENVISNQSDTFNRSNYVFYAFKLGALNLSRVCGYSLSYELIDDDYSNGTYQLDHSLMFYEVLFPNSTWR